MYSTKKWKRRAINFLNKHPQLMWIKKKVDFEKNLKPKLRKQLEFKSNITLPLNLSSKKILVPLIETSHYQYLQVLIVAKALQLRGGDVKVLLCGSRLDGCEIKSSRTQSKDPCLNCRFNAKEVVPLFQLDTLNLENFISDSEVRSLRTSALKIANFYPKKYNYEGIDLIPIVNDSVVRFFYGKIPDDAQKLMLVRAQHLTSAMISCEVAKRINRSFCRDIIFNNMNVYTAWESYYRYFQKEKKSLFTCSISTFNFNAIVLNIMERYMSNSQYEIFRKNRDNSYLNKEDYCKIYEFHKDRHFDLTLVASMQHHTVPFGVCEIENKGHLKEIREKPEYDFLVNTGMYVLEPLVPKLIPVDEYFDMTDLISKSQKEGLSIGVYPVSEKSYIDVGQLAGYKKILNSLLDS